MAATGLSTLPSLPAVHISDLAGKHYLKPLCTWTTFTAFPLSFGCATEATPNHNFASTGTPAGRTLSTPAFGDYPHIGAGRKRNPIPTTTILFRRHQGRSSLHNLGERPSQRTLWSASRRRFRLPVDTKCYSCLLPIFVTAARPLPVWPAQSPGTGLALPPRTADGIYLLIRWRFSSERRYRVLPCCGNASQHAGSGQLRDLLGARRAVAELARQTVCGTSRNPPGAEARP